MSVDRGGPRRPLVNPPPRALGEDVSKNKDAFLSLGRGPALAGGPRAGGRAECGHILPAPPGPPSLLPIAPTLPSVRSKPHVTFYVRIAQSSFVLGWPKALGPTWPSSGSKNLCISSAPPSAPPSPLPKKPEGTWENLGFVLGQACWEALPCCMQESCPASPAPDPLCKGVKVVPSIAFRSELRKARIIVMETR